MASPSLDRQTERQFVEIDVERVAWDEDYRDALKQVLAVEATLKSDRSNPEGESAKSPGRGLRARRTER